MNQLIRKYFWAVKLAGIALLALLTAGFVNDWVGSKFFLAPSPPNVDAADAAQTQAEPAFGRVAAGVVATRVLSQRRIFNLDPPQPVVSEAETPKEEPKEEEPPHQDGEVEDSQLPIDLVGTLVAVDAANSVATFQIQGENKIGWVGSEFLDGKAKIDSIGQRYVVFLEGDHRTVVRLWGAKNAGAAQPGMPGRPDLKYPLANPPTAGIRPPPTPGGGPADRAQSIREGIQKTGAYDYQISRSMLDSELKDLGKLQSEARVVPHYKDQQYQGFKLVGVRPGSLYRAIGIRSGDVITAVNGTAIDSPNKALELFEQLKNSADIKVDIERRGQAKTLSYQIH